MKKLISIVLLMIFIFSVFLSVNYLLEMNQSRNVMNDLKSIEASRSIQKDLTTYVEDRKKENQNNRQDQIDDQNTLIKEESSNTINEMQTYTFVDNPEKAIFDEIENYVGWIKIDETYIDYPVVKYQDNEFYLNHGYDLKENIAGAIFMDRRNLGNQFDQHTIIYGHRMKNNTMFTDLNLYLDERFFNENQLITFRDLYNTYTYKVFSAYNISADDYVLAYDIDQNVIDEFKKVSNYFNDHMYEEGNRYLTLSTCNYEYDNGRMLVHAVLIQVN